MPQVATHFIIAEKLKTQLGNPAFINNHNEAYNLGAVGPDLSLFLFDPVGTSDWFNKLVNIYSTFHKFKKLFKEINDKATGPVDDFADWVSGGLSTQLIDMLGMGYSALISAIQVNLTSGGSVTVQNPFVNLNIPGIPNDPDITVHSSDISFFLRQFGHPFTQDLGRNPLTGNPYKMASRNYDDWWWMDLLHYRRTMAFASRLNELAGGNDLLKAYSAGYWSHVGGDIVGHPYVNSVVGGPFRSHVIRHMVIENIIDTWVWDHYKNEDIINSKLHEKIDVGGDFDKISKVLIEGLKDIYTKSTIFPPIQPQHFTNSTPTQGNFRRAYDLYLLFLELSTDSGIQRPVPPPSNPQEFFEEIGDSIADTFGSMTEQFSGDNEWWEWLLAPFSAAAYGLVLLFKLATLPAAVLIRVITLAPRWFAYMLQMAIYNYIINARWQLALSGWGKPSKEDLNRSFAQMAIRIPGDRSGTSAFKYPYEQVPHDDFGFWLRDPRDFPGMAIEDSGYESSPYPKAALPNIIIDGPDYNVPDDGDLSKFASSLRFIDTRKIEERTYSRPQFGNAVNFSKMLIEGSYPSGHFDLDGDKGYGFLGWNRELIFET